MTSRCSCAVHCGCWGHPLLIIEHPTFLMRQWISSAHTATLAAGFSPSAFYLLCSCELFLCSPSCGGIRTCGDKILFLPCCPSDERMCAWSDAHLVEAMLEYWNQKIPHGETAVVKEENWIKWNDLGGQLLKKKNGKKKKRRKTIWKWVNLWGQYKIQKSTRKEIGKSTKMPQQAEWEGISNKAREAKRLIKSLLTAGLYHNLPYGFFKCESVNKPC